MPRALLAAFGLLLAAAAVAPSPARAAAAEAEELPGVDLSGLTVEQAKERLGTLSDRLQRGSIVVEVADGVTAAVKTMVVPAS